MPQKKHSSCSSKNSKATGASESAIKSQQRSQASTNLCVEMKGVIEDEDDLFAKIVAVDLKNVKDAKTKRVLKRKINDLIYEVLDEQEREMPAGTRRRASNYCVVLPTGEVMNLVF